MAALAGNVYATGAAMGGLLTAGDQKSAVEMLAPNVPQPEQVGNTQQKEELATKHNKESSLKAKKGLVCKGEGVSAVSSFLSRDVITLHIKGDLYEDLSCDKSEEVAFKRKLRTNEASYKNRVYTSDKSVWFYMSLQLQLSENTGAGPFDGFLFAKRKDKEELFNLPMKCEYFGKYE